MIQSLKNTKHFIRYYKKRIIIISLLILLLFGIGVSFAMSEDNVMISLIYSMIDTITSTETIQEVTEIVTVGYSDTSITLGGYTVNNMGTVMEIVNDAMITFAIVFCSTLFFVGLTNAFLNQQAYEEIIIKRLIVFGIVIGLIAWSLPLCLNIANLGSGIAAKISNITNDSFDITTADTIATLKADILANCSTSAEHTGIASLLSGVVDIFTALVYILQLLVPWVAMHAVRIVIKTVCWGRALEILILSTLSPLAFCDISSGQGTGMGSIGRFLRNFAATAIQGAIIVLIMFYCSQIHIAIISQNTSAAAFFNNTWNIVVIGFVEVGLCTKSQGMAQRLIGAA